MNDARYGDSLPYTYGYCAELDPLRLNFALLRAGLAAPDVGTACELGYGQGVSVNVHAAGSDVAWFGTDANPGHAQFAMQLAHQAGTGAQLSGQRFDAFCRRDDLPPFDYIGMHGIWSWVGAADRALLLDFIARKLKPGGVLYLSYNTLPAWNTMLPVRALLLQHFEAAAPASPQHESAPQLQARISAAVGFVQALFASQPGYALLHPQVAERVQALSRENPAYLAHEYFNRDWQPMTFAQAAQDLNAAGLSYAGSAHYRDHFDFLNLSAAQRDFLAGTADEALRETARDFCTHRSLRREYWVKQAPPLDAAQRAAALRRSRLILALPRAAVVLKVRGALSETALPLAIYEPILDMLAGHRVMSLGQLEDGVAAAGIGLEQLVEAVMLLIDMGVLLNVQDEPRIAAARAAAARFNALVCARAVADDCLHYLVSPVSGSAIAIPRLARLFLLARSKDGDDATVWGRFAAQVLGVAPEVAMQQAQKFASVQLPVLEALGVA